MFYLKKLFFAPFFLLAFATLCSQLKPILFSPDIIFAFDIYQMLPLIYISLAIFASSFLFILFGTLSQSWNFNLPIIIMTIIINIFFFQGPVGWVIASGFALSLVFSSLSLESKLQSAANFQPASMLTPVVNNLSFMLTVIVAIAYFLSMSVDVNTQVFHVPDALIEKAIDLSGQSFDVPVSSTTPTSPVLVGLTPEEIEKLKQNPEILAQSGIDPSILNSIDQLSSDNLQSMTVSQISRSVVKETIKTKLDEMLQMYSNYIPALLGITIFTILKLLVSVVSIFTLPLVWISFWIMHKIKLITIIVEIREVKRLAVD